MRPAAEILVVEAGALRPILAEAPSSGFDLPTVCADWSVRDVLAHCGAALTATASGELHGFTPADNQRDVDERRSWPLRDVLDELFRGYQAAAVAIDAAGGRLDGIGLGEWMHGGDVREALGRSDAYVSEGIELALGLLCERSASRGRPRIDVHVSDRVLPFGTRDGAAGRVETDVATFVRLCGNRRPDLQRARFVGCGPDDFVLFD